MSLDEYKILLIDDKKDEYINIRNLLSQIASVKYSLIWESTYEDGLQALTSEGFDACLLDSNLGERTGLELLQEARGRGINNPVIFLTEKTDFEVDVQAMQVGASDYLVKTQLTSHLLERSIRYAIKHGFDFQQLRESNDRFKVLFNSTFAGFFVLKNDIIFDVNSPMEPIFGYRREEMTGLSVLRFLHPDFHDPFIKGLRSEATVGSEMIGIRKDGQDIPLELSSRIINFRGQSMHLIAIRDLTERKQMEAQILQQDRLASLGLLASGLAHEIGTPMGVIRGRAEMVIKKVENEFVKENMNLIVSQIDRISKLVHSLLHLARSSAPNTGASVSLNRVVESVLTLVRHELAQKDIPIEIKFPGESVVRAEAGPLGQVFLNLLVNSIHAIEEARRSGRTGGHKISLSVEELDKKIKICIQDSGCGIPEKNLSQIFKPFFTTKDIGSGTGLGLAISFKLVQSWNGNIDVKSQVGSGSLFTVTLLRP